MRDHIVLQDERGSMIVNMRSYMELLKWLIVAYVGVPYKEASSCIEQHRDYFDHFDITVTRVTLESHSWPYYDLAMDFYFGDCRKAVTVRPPPDTRQGVDLYRKIENYILKEHHLKDPFDYRE